MGLIRYAIAAGIGYYAGQPEGRRQLQTLRRRTVELAHGPEVRRLRERGWDLVGDGVLATRNYAAKARSGGNQEGEGPDGGGRRVLRGLSSLRRPRPDSAATADPVGGTGPGEGDGPAGFNGTTVAEDSKAAVLGLPAPPLAARDRPAAPPENGA